MIRKIITILLIIIPCFARAEISVDRLIASDDGNAGRFILDLSAPIKKYNAFTLDNPPRVVVDIADIKWSNGIPPYKETTFIKNVRHSVKQDGTLRIVLDLTTALSMTKHFTLPATAGKPDRLVIELASDTYNPPIPDSLQTEEDLARIPVPVLRKMPRKPMIIIDPGHGGRDPGAIGRKGTQEKDLTLAYSLELRDQLLEAGNYEVYLTRDNDSFIELHDRVKKGRSANGDLFISIHANSHPNNQTSGLCIYTLSETASDKEADALAQKENKAGLINGIDLDREEDELTSLFIDMAQRETKNVSASFAENLIEHTKHEVELLYNPHRFVGFRVLTGADIPSVLIELGYITNKKEEKLLNSKNYKKKLANAFVKAIDNHFKNYPIE